MQSLQKYCCLIFSWACRDSDNEKSNKINSNVMEQSAGSTYAVGLWCCQAPHPRLKPMRTRKVVGPIEKLEPPRTIQMSNRPFFSLFPIKQWDPQSQLDSKNKTKSVSQNHLKHYFRAVHQPVRGFLLKIEDVLHNIISRKTVNKPKEMNAVSTKVLLRFFPPVCTFAPSIFSQVGLTILWNTKGALILSCCTF